MGVYYTILEINGKSFKTDYIAKLAHVMMIIVMSGVFATIMLMYLYQTNRKSVTNAVSFFTNEQWKVFLPGILITTYMFLNIKALSEGGGVVMAILSANIIITLLGGYFFANDELDVTLSITVLLIIILTGFAAYHSAKLHKN